MVKPAEFLIKIEDITMAGFMALLIKAIENKDYTKAEKDTEIENFYSALVEFETNTDHGLAHSHLVFDRSLEVIDGCPNIARIMSFSGLENQQITALLSWASLLHDFGRFLGYDLIEHQKFGAELAKQIFAGQAEVTLLMEMLANHDYICPLVDGQALPLPLLFNPLAEIFRLADKTSLAPAEEIERYYLTGKRLGGVFYNPALTLDQRADFSFSLQQKEFLSYFLVLFAIQPTDFFLSETAELYRRWAEGKKDAVHKINLLALAEKLTPDQFVEIEKIIDDFNHRILKIKSPTD